MLEDERRLRLEQVPTASRVVDRLIDPPFVPPRAPAPHLERPSPVVVDRACRPQQDVPRASAAVEVQLRGRRHDEIRAAQMQSSAAARRPFGRTGRSRGPCRANRSHRPRKRRARDRPRGRASRGQGQCNQGEAPPPVSHGRRLDPPRARRAHRCARPVKIGFTRASKAGAPVSPSLTVVDECSATQHPTLAPLTSAGAHSTVHACRTAYASASPPTVPRAAARPPESPPAPRRT